MIAGVNLDVGWQFDLAVVLPLLIAFVVAAILLARAGRAFERELEARDELELRRRERASW